VAFFPNVAPKVVFSDNINTGNVYTSTDADECATCGIVCCYYLSSNNVIAAVENCVNYGNIKGPYAYGITNRVEAANNIVSLGTMNGTKESYSFWKEATSLPTSLYGLNDKCKSCDGNVTLIRMNDTDGHYHTVNKNEIVDTLLNEEADKQGYKMGWEKDLTLRKRVTIQIGNPVKESVRVWSGITLEESGISSKAFDYHLIAKGTTAAPENEYKKTSVIEDDIELIPYHMINISGTITKTVYVKADGSHTLDESEELKEYLESSSYAVGDGNEHGLLDGKSAISGDMDVIVMKRNMVSIEFEGTIRSSEAKTNEIAKSIHKLTGIEMNSILIDVEGDKEGNVVRIIVILKDADLCEKVVIAIQNLVKDKSQCSKELGLLCHSINARIVVEGPSLSLSHCDDNHNGLLLTIVLVLMMVRFELLFA